MSERDWNSLTEDEIENLSPEEGKAYDAWSARNGLGELAEAAGLSCIDMSSILGKERAKLEAQQLARDLSHSLGHALMLAPSSALPS